MGSNTLSKRPFVSLPELSLQRSTAEARYRYEDTAKSAAVEKLSNQKLNKEEKEVL
jgi:hypothetical protein